MSPTHAPSPCVEPGCFNLAVARGRCALCAIPRSEYDLNRESARKRGYDGRWERRRRRHLSIEPFCRMCRAPAPAKEVDHVIPHRGARWLFDLKGNLQTLCRHHHAQKTARERSIPIGMMYPLDLPPPPHYRPTALRCGPSVGTDSDLEARNRRVRLALGLRTSDVFVLEIAAPRTAERAFWSHVMDCPTELELPETGEGKPLDWWGPYDMDRRAETGMARRLR